jgi:hypothetical protein
VTAPDNVLVSGWLDAVVSIHVDTIHFVDSNYRMEGYNSLTPMPVPERFTIAAPGTPTGAPANIGQLYRSFGKAIRSGVNEQPTFEIAVEMHRLLGTMREASENRREVRAVTGVRPPGG